MRRSEFDRAVTDEFGTRGSALVADLVLTRVGGLTAREALAAGTPAREVWVALCIEADVPDDRRYGVGRLDARRR
ncbi:MULTISPECIES: DUF3046 domain-containing protein [unclassified Microbacterium]|uniref:DUF3046 domain-containing protein n=1 Tax=unclassified Microbacterium TaxID=2609290 RepID=UPI00214B56B5|nr:MULTISPECIES: DUF3046 domain-containing protein [unclassified Microbacterium]MCR2786005.1 DUF3046 domain-containing protein [Microbacterium sp. zg.B96]MDL5352928.1 DUF3046 domain-containing protein [Microbacterium sp. zg-YB36]WIM16961.1 DUF3046 domain-containing protein [Microbacterium sp. zg-B96]